MPKKEAINAKGASKPIGPYSTGISYGNLIFISGQIPVNPQTGKIPESIAEQTRQCLENIKIQVEAAGSTMDDILQCQVFLTDMNNFAEMNSVYSQYFSEPYPTRMAVEVSALPKGVSIEIAAIAGKN